MRLCFASLRFALLAKVEHRYWVTSNVNQSAFPAFDRRETPLTCGQGSELERNNEVSTSLIGVEPAAAVRSQGRRGRRGRHHRASGAERRDDRPVIGQRTA